MNGICKVIALTVWCLSACSGQLRGKPQLDCQADADSTGVVCSDGIIGSCVGGAARFSVCPDVSVCEASWQQAGSYKCTPDNALLDVYAAEPALHASVRVLDSTALVIEVRNAWLETAHAVTGTLSTTQPDVSIVSGAELYFGDIDSGASACGATSQTYAGACGADVLPRFAAADSGGTTLSFMLALVDGDGNRFDEPLSIVEN